VVALIVLVFLVFLVFLVVLVILVIPLDAPYYIFCLRGMIPDVAVEKGMSAPDGLRR